MTFHYPEAFVLVFLVFFVIYLYKFKKNKWLSISVSCFELMKKNMKSSYIKRNILFFFKISVLILLIVAISRPIQNNTQLEKKLKWVDIVLAFDTSLSMLAEDMKPNRITVAKNTVEGFISKLRPWDRFSLVVFSWRAFTYVPLSLDMNIIKTFVSYISTNLINQNIIGLNWTWIWNAILSSIAKFDDTPWRQKIIILMTDWESNRWISPISSAKLAEEMWIKIYSIWIWEKDWSIVPYLTQDWEKEHIKNPDWSLYLTFLDEDPLRMISMQTNWKYFWANSKNLLEDVFDKIYELEVWEIEISQKIKQKERYFDFLLLAFLLYFLESILYLSLFRKKI